MRFFTKIFYAPDGGGALVNATGNYVNAYTGTTTAFSGTDTLTSTMKTYYDTELLENARPELIHAQFAKKQPLPKGKGKSVEWRKWNTLADAGKLTEGVIPTGQKLGQSAITQTIDQYGTYVAVSDQLELHAIDDVILGATEELGASAGTTQDKLVRDALMAGTSVQYCDKVVSGTHTARRHVQADAGRGQPGGDDAQKNEGPEDQRQVHCHHPPVGRVRPAVQQRVD